MLRATLLILACFALSAMAVEEPAHPLTNMPPPGYISTSIYFPEHPNKRFGAGEMVKIVLGMHNDGTDSYNMTMIMGSLNNPQDFSMHYQNFTQEIYGHVLAPGEELTMEYTFRPDPFLPPRDFIVAVSVFYSNNENKWFSNQFFNQTIDIKDMKKLVDTDLIMMFITIVAAIVGLGYVFADQLMAGVQKMGLMKKGKRSTKVKKSDAPKVDNSEDWVKGTPYDTFRKTKAKAAAKKTAASS